jgi:response regulator RpfG family c-di-GMP phosphodiesterase
VKSSQHLRRFEAPVKTVLLLEDDQISQALYKRVLGRRWSVLMARAPDDALQLCQSNPIDLFVADNLLPATLSGVETLHRVHSVEPNLRLMLVSGTPPEGFDSDHFKCFEELVCTGVFDYLEKPFTAEVLTDRAAALIDGPYDPGTVQRRLADAKEYRRGASSRRNQRTRFGR